MDDRVKHDTMISNSISTDIVTKSDLARKELHKDAILDAILAIGPDAIENPNPFPDEDVYVLSLHKRMDNIEARVDALKHTLALNRVCFITNLVLYSLFICLISFIRMYFSMLNQDWKDLKKQLIRSLH